MSLPLSRPSLRRQDFDHVLDALVHDRLTSGEVTRQLGKEVGSAFRLKETSVLASAADGVRRVARGLGWTAGDKVVVSPLAPPYWAQVLPEMGVEVLFADVLENSPVLDPEAVKSLAGLGPKAVVSDTCLGYLPDIQALGALGLPVVEDISQGWGGRLGAQAPGTMGVAVLAQFAPETLVAGAGGCLVGFRSAVDLAPPQAWESLSDLGSALILSQWKDAATMAEKKKEHFRQLFHRLPKGYRQPKQAGDAEVVGPWFPVLCDSGAKDVLAHARKKAVEADWAFRSQPHLNADSSGEFCPRARAFLFRTLVFPLYATFSLKELDLLGKVISSLP